MKNCNSDELLICFKIFDKLVLDNKMKQENVLFMKMSDFSQLSVLNIISKCLRGKNDLYLKQSSLFILSKLLKNKK